jgi:hypothetical protein
MATTEPHRAGRAFVLVVALLVAALALPGCTTIRVTVTDEDGSPLSDIGVSAFESYATTDSKGVTTLRGVPTGKHQLRFSGRGYCDVLRIVVEGGLNRVSYQLLPMMGIWPPQPLAGIARMRIRVGRHLEPRVPTAEGTLVRGKGIHWKMPDGSEVISMGASVYVKLQGQPWQLYKPGCAGEQAAEAAVEATAQLSKDIQLFEAALEDAATHVKQSGWTAGVPEDFGSFSVRPANWPWVYVVYVVATGEYRGSIRMFATESGGGRTFELYDFDGAFDIAAPM